MPPPPRALPWAGMSDPFRVKSNEFAFNANVFLTIALSALWSYSYESKTNIFLGITFIVITERFVDRDYNSQNCVGPAPSPVIAEMTGEGAGPTL